MNSVNLMSVKVMHDCIVLCLFEVWKKDKSTTHSTLTMVIFSAFLVHTSTSVSSTFPSKEGLLYTHTPLTGFSHSLIFNFVVCLVRSLYFKRKKEKHSLVKYFREARSTLCHTAVYSSLVHKTSMHGKTH